LLLESGLYKIRHHQGYNFFPRTPHIEHLVTLDVR
jgi:23S rRNA (uracil1939-C5)-methyltransferase